MSNQPEPTGDRGTADPTAARATIRVVTDSACDLPQAVADDLGIEIVPLTIRIDGQEFVDRNFQIESFCGVTPKADAVLGVDAADVPQLAFTIEHNHFRRSFRSHRIGELVARVFE